jgi:hypothetical protein
MSRDPADSVERVAPAPGESTQAPAKLKAYPAGSFVMIPAGLPHFAATKQGPVIVQLNGTGKWGTDYIEK